MNFIDAAAWIRALGQITNRLSRPLCKPTTTSLLTSLFAGSGVQPLANHLEGSFSSQLGAPINLVGQWLRPHMRGPGTSIQQLLTQPPQPHLLLIHLDRVVHPRSRHSTNDPEPSFLHIMGMIEMESSRTRNAQKLTKALQEH